MKLDQAIREYIISLSTAEGKAKNTVESYSRDLKQYSDYLKENSITDTSKIKEETIYSYIDDLNDRYASTSINRIKTTIRNFHRYLNFKYNLKDPSLNVATSKGKKRLPVYATKQEIEKLMSVFNDEDPQDLFDHTILETIYGLGLRVSECCDMRTSQVNLTDGFVKILGKGNKERLIPIPDKTKKLMHMYFANVRTLWQKKNTNRFFINHFGKPIYSEYVENKPVQQNSASQSSSSSQVDGDYGAYASMVEQAKMISQLTGLPADVIFAQLAFETGQNPSDMAYSDKIHNYGGTVVDMGHGQNASGFGIYVNNQEGAEAYVKGTAPVREQLPQLREAIAQGDLKKYVHLLKYGMEESGKGNYQYFTGDENGYLNGIMSYLSLAHKFGLNGVIPNGTYDFSAVIQRLQNLKPKTLKEQWDENISNYKTSVGNGKIIKGAYTHNGLYLDASLSAPSIIEENQRLREKYVNGLYNDDTTPSTENIMTPEKLAEFEKKKMYLSFKAVQEETKMMVEAERKKSQQKDVIFRRTLEEAKAKTEKELNKEEKDDRDTIVLNVLAKLKDGLSSKQINQIYQEVNKILTDNGFEADSYITQT